MRWTRAVAALALVGLAAAGASACDSSESSGDASAFLAAIANNATFSIAKIDYHAIGDDELASAGETICRRLAGVDRTPNGLDLERAETAIVSRYDLARAVPKPGAEQDPGVPLRNADLRLASAIGVAALDHLCPDQPFDPAD